MHQGASQHSCDGCACAALNQFQKALDKNQAQTLFKLLMKYRPEDKSEKKERLLKEAEARSSGQVRQYLTSMAYMYQQPCFTQHAACGCSTAV